MRVVYCARNVVDAQSARAVLAGIGISAHIADQQLWEIAGHRIEADVIRVLVDNRRWDKARRVIEDWVKTSARKTIADGPIPTA